MSKFLRSKRVQFTFDDEDVYVTIRPMKMIDCATAISTMLGATEDQKAMAGALGVLLPPYIEKVEGLKDAAGAELGVSELCTEMYFMKLAAQVLKEMIRLSMPEDPQKLVVSPTQSSAE